METLIYGSLGVHYCPLSHKVDFLLEVAKTFNLYQHHLSEKITELTSHTKCAITN